jgi:hypothetical protein
VPAKVESGDIMNKSSDVSISRLLKNWTGQYRPPSNAQARLLWEAAHQAQRKSPRFSLFPRPQFYNPPCLASDEWSQTLFIWVNEHTFQAGLLARLT